MSLNVPICPKRKSSKSALFIVFLLIIRRFACFHFVTPEGLFWSLYVVVFYFVRALGVKHGYYLVCTDDACDEGKAVDFGCW